jgi:hypothetical protein
MKFWHEKKLAAIRRYERYIAENKQDIMDADKLIMSGITWEIADTLDNFSAIIVDYDYNEVSLYFYKAVTATYFEDVFDYVENTLNAYGYNINVDYFSANTGSSATYEFLHETLPRIIIKINSGVCQVEKTGRYIPETKTNCNFIQGV